MSLKIQILITRNSVVGTMQTHLRHEKTPSDLSNKLLIDKPFTDDNIKRLANDINQAFLRPQQAFSPIPDDYHVSTSGYEAPTISVEQCHLGPLYSRWPR